VPNKIRQSHRIIGVLVCATASLATAGRPPDLPGDEITSQYLQQMIPQDSIAAHAPAVPSAAPTWLDEAGRSWEAPPLGEQISADKTNIPVGKGAAFIPRFSDATNEPEIEIIDSTGALLAHGNPGTARPMLPGRYFVVFGSGSHKQRMVRAIDIVEGKTTPVIPDWAGLSIDVVDTNQISYRGEFELTRMDDIESFGRGFGIDPSLGEQIKTWILKPGLYKITGPGENFNTLRNFVTVELLPGRLTKFLLMENPGELNRIISGGVVTTKVNQLISKDWRYGVDIGGNILTTASIDHKNPAQDAASSSIALLLNTWIRYNKNPVDWNTYVRANEGLNLSNITIKSLDNILIQNNLDEVRLSSLYIWLVISWVGPYGRFEISPFTNLFPKRIQPNKSTQKYIYGLTSNGQRDFLDSIASSWQIEPSFSPLALNTGVGVNFDLLNVRFLEARLITGFRYKFSHESKHYGVGGVNDVDSTLAVSDSQFVRHSLILKPVSASTSNSAGPEAGLSFELRIGNRATLKTDAQIFAPVAPEVHMDRPDIDLNAIFSWHISRAFSLDYQYTYTLTQELGQLQELSEHQLLFRYSFTSR
jgi:hypothetical protein